MHFGYGTPYSFTNANMYCFERPLPLPMYHGEKQLQLTFIRLQSRCRVISYARSQSTNRPSSRSCPSKIQPILNTRSPTQSPTKQQRSIPNHFSNTTRASLTNHRLQPHAQPIPQPRTNPRRVNLATSPDTLTHPIARTRRRVKGWRRHDVVAHR